MLTDLPMIEIISFSFSKRVTSLRMRMRRRERRTESEPAFLPLVATMAISTNEAQTTAQSKALRRFVK